MVYVVRALVVLSAMLLATAAAYAQGATLVTGGYSLPLISIAPNQVITFWLAGLSPIPNVPVYAAQPLPTSLANLSVTINQVYRAYSASLPVPIVSVNQTNNCDADYPTTSPSCLITAITVLIPATLISDPYYNEAGTSVVVSQSAIASQAFNVHAVPDSIHVLTTCGSGHSVCVTHADGSLVSPSSPASAGEVVVIYAVGFGAMNGIFANFDFHPNASASQPVDYKAASQGGTEVAPQYVGETPGQIGLYQMNVKVPDALPPVPACTASEAVPVFSNLTITVASTPQGVSSGSWDGAPICVQPLPQN